MVRKHVNSIIPDLLFLFWAGYVFSETATRFVSAGAATGGALTNAAFYPRILAGLIVGLALCNIIKHAYLARKGHRLVRKTGDTDMDIDPAARTPETRHYFLAFGCLGWFWLYIFSLETVGYLIATPIMLAGLLAALGVRNPLSNLSYAAGGTIGMYLFFQEMLDVILPMGLLGIWMD